MDKGSGLRIKSYLRPGIGQLGTYEPRGVVHHEPVDCAPALAENAPRITIVVPSYNQGIFLGDTLKSILDQQYPNLELIVVDGGSTDESLDIIKRYGTQISWWVSEKDAGQASAINKGFQRSTGEIMAWVNSDDLVAPGALNFVSKYFLENSTVHALYGDRIVINDSGLEIGRWILPAHSYSILKWVDFIPQETLFWRRSAWEAVESHIDEQFAFAMDWDFLLRLSKINRQIVHVPRFLGLFRVHGSQKTSSQMTSIGLTEMDILRRRELGFSPRKWQIIARVAPYILKARWLDFRYRMSLKR